MTSRKAPQLRELHNLLALFTRVRGRSQAVEKVGVGQADGLGLGSKRPRMGVFDVKPRTRIRDEGVFQHVEAFSEVRIQDLA